MKTSFFQRTYHLINTFIFLSLISLFLYVGFFLLYKSISTIHIMALDNTISILLHFLSIAEHYLSILTCGLFLIPSLLLLIELFWRIKRDNLWNYFRSINQTKHLRQFLKQEEKGNSVVPMDDKTKVTKVNPILEEFNQTINRCLVDVHKKSITVLVPYPITQQAQKLLKDMEDHIKEEVSNQNPDYYFSSPNREGKYLWYIGTRR